MASDDKHLTLSEIARMNRASIVSQLAGIGSKRHHIEHAKVRYHIEKLQCFQPKGVTLYRREINAFEERNYLALSYTWKPSEYESRRNRLYFVEEQTTKFKKRSKVRNCVMYRALRYMRHVRVPLLWIDQHSIRQDTCGDENCDDYRECAEKREAVQAMDVVYERSNHPVGLLTRPVNTSGELQLLGRILHGEFVDDRKSLATSVRAAKKALNLLYEITRERWWTRAWTFQENYRGGIRMYLLIPHHQSLEFKKREYDVFGQIPGELRVLSITLFEQATRLCQALGSRTKPHTGLACQINKVLYAASRYTLLLHESDSMTPTVVADIEDRELEKPWDRLAIMANCCRYSMRLDGAGLEKRGQSLSLSMLAMCLLNGEILDNRKGSEPRAASELTTSVFLNRYMYRNFKAPRDERRKLTYNKSCRLFDVQLTKDGIQTLGHLWELGPIIDTASFPSRRKVYRNAQGWLRADERQCLYQLKRRLGQMECFELENWLGHRLAADARAKPWAQFKSFSDHYIHLMATEVAATIQGRRKLRLGSIYSGTSPRTTKPPTYRGIFVLPDENGTQYRTTPAFAFTSMREGDPGCEMLDNNDLDRHVSLMVVRESPSKGKVPRLRTHGWLLGMCNIEKCPPEEVLFPWPRELAAIAG